MKYEIIPIVAILHDQISEVFKQSLQDQQEEWRDMADHSNENIYNIDELMEVETFYNKHQQILDELKDICDKHQTTIFRINDTP